MLHGSHGTTYLKNPTVSVTWWRSSFHKLTDSIWFAYPDVILVDTLDRGRDDNLNQLHTNFSNYIRNFNERKPSDRSLLTRLYRLEVDDHPVESDTRSLECMCPTTSTGTLRALTSAGWTALEDNLLDQLGVNADPYIGGTTCLPGTRVEELSSVKLWINDFDAPNILYISGGPGTGKTALARSVVEMVEDEQRCGARYFGSSSNRYSVELWRSVSWSMAQFSPDLRRSIVSAIPLVDLGDPMAVYDRLVAEPLKAYASARFDGPSPIFLVDAIDIFAAPQAQESWDSFLKILTAWSTLPKTCKIIITSRPRQEIVDSLQGTGHVQMIKLVTGNFDSGEHHAAINDVSVYLRYRLSEIQRAHKSSKEKDMQSLPDVWPRAEQVEKLVKHANGWFFWAKAAMDSVEKSLDPDRTLSTIASTGAKMKLPEVDAMYNRFLTDTFSRAPPDGFHAFIGAIALAKEPTTVHNICRLFSDRFPSEQSAIPLLTGLQSMISVNEGECLALLHPSLAEFLLDSKRCDENDDFVLDRTRTRRKLAIACLRMLLDDKDGLKFNPLDTGFSETFNDLHLPNGSLLGPSLLYACDHWASHLADTSENTGREVEISRLLRELLQKRCLFWIEVMSYKDKHQQMFKSLMTAHSW